MNQKGFSKALAIISVIIIISGVAGYFTYFRKLKALPASTQTNSNQIPSVQNPANVPSSKNRPATRIIRSTSKDSFVIEIDGVSYTIFVKAETVILNNARGKISFSDLKSGDSIKVILDPAQVNKTAVATWIQDVSI